MSMEIHDADIAAGINSCFSYTTKCSRYFYHIAFLETCKMFDVLPGGLKITNVPFISFVTDDIKVSWNNTTTSEKDLLKSQTNVVFFVLLLLCNTYTYWFLVHIYIYIHIDKWKEKMQADIYLRIMSNQLAFKSLCRKD